MWEGQLRAHHRCFAKLRVRDIVFMRRFLFLSLSVLPMLGTLVAEETLPVFSKEVETPALPIPEKPKPSLVSFKQPFTGKITGSRVRLRTQPSLSSFVMREYSPSDLVQVVGEIDDFYAVLPDPSDKGYVFRTYVLDGIVEGSNVNLRLKPDMTSPIILQLQQGDKVQGKLSAENPKWLEVSLPPSVHFYVAKEFISNEGPLSLFKERIRQKEQVLAQLKSLEESTKKELDKPFAAINLSSAKNELETLINTCKKNQPELAGRASTLLRKMQEEYLQLSVQKNDTLIAQAPAEQPAPIAEIPPPQPTSSPAKEPTVSFFLKEQEQALVQKKIESNEASSQTGLYEKEKKFASPLKGKLVPFERQLKIKPGDFILIDPITKVPMAYLYSTTVDLMPYVGSDVVVEAAPRPDYNFALPAFFVHEIRQQGK